MEVIDYCREKYGHDKVAQCVIYGTIKTKQALKDSARIMGYEFAMGEKVTKALPPAATGGKDVPLHDIFDPRPSATPRRVSSASCTSRTRTSSASPMRRWASRA